MTVYITFTLDHNGNRYDLQADDNQVIRRMLAVVQGNMRVSFDAARTNYVKTYRRPETVSVDATFAQAGIYSGDILRLIDEEVEPA
jgi:uncharacterized ubiquitin-like protein YukD